MLKVVVFCCVLAALAKAFLVKNTCSSDSDCPNTHCCYKDYHGMNCHPYQNDSQPCHLAGHHHILYHCNCSPGYTCEPIHLSSSDATDDPLHTVDLQLAKAGYGLCKSSIATPVG